VPKLVFHCEHARPTVVQRIANEYVILGEQLRMRDPVPSPEQQQPKAGDEGKPVAGEVDGTPVLYKYHIVFIVVRCGLLSLLLVSSSCGTAEA
jgi:hypothetical protein